MQHPYVLYFLISDLDTLLSLGFVPFWAHVLNDLSILRFFDSYLWYAQHRRKQLAPSAPKHGSNPTISALESDIACSTLKLLLRLSQSEGPAEYIPGAAFGAMLYENYVFTSHTLIDIAVMYGPSNQEIVSKLMANVLSVSPAYCENLAQVRLASLPPTPP